MADQARESLNVDVLCVGAGIANLCAAYHLAKTVKQYNTAAIAAGKPTVKEPSILVIEKGKEVGYHNLSGAIVDPIGLKELFPELAINQLPFIQKVEREKVMFFGRSWNIRVPGFVLPSAMRNAGLYLATIGSIVTWLAKKCTALGVEIFTEFAITELIKKDSRIAGAKIADKKVDAEGKPEPGYTPGMDIFAKVTVLGEGTHGFLSERLIDEYKLARGCNPRLWGLGLKEIIDIPQGRVSPGSVLHMIGYPIDINSYGGSFLYALSGTQVVLGLVIGLDYKDPMFDSHDAFQRLKAHPFIANIIEGGKVASYGAKSLPEGGWFALPGLAVDGALLVGDSAGFANTMSLKGIHLAAKSGMLAAERIGKALASDDMSAGSLDYSTELRNSWAGKELYKARNFRQSFRFGLFPGLFLGGINKFSFGIIPPGRMSLPPDRKGLKKVKHIKKALHRSKRKPDNRLYLDIETDVYMSGTIHREQQPSHCRILSQDACRKCYEQYRAPCTRFCPAKVYEEKLDANGRFDGIHVSFTNCVHCKTCEIKDPFSNLEWHPPEGGDGPRYKNM